MVPFAVGNILLAATGNYEVVKAKRTKQALL